jgi:hypothetical protein
MHRRDALKALFVLPNLFMFPSGQRRFETLSFPVAGARYYGPVCDLQRGDVVTLRHTEVHGRDAIAVFAGTVQIGWIPKPILARVPERVTRATICRVRPYEVPWRWYWLSIEVAAHA